MSHNNKTVINNSYFYFEEITLLPIQDYKVESCVDCDEVLKFNLKTESLFRRQSSHLEPGQGYCKLKWAYI